MKKLFFVKKKHFKIIICMVIFAFINYYWFKNIGEKVFLIGDDVRFFNYIKASDNILKTIFSNEIGTYRPVPYFVMMIFIKIFGTVSKLYFYANLTLNYIIMISIFGVIYHLCNQNLFISFSAPVFYLTAIYSYYGITQLLGFMELLCILWSVWFFYFLLKYIEGKTGKYYLFSVIVFFLATFSHERFLVFFGVYIILNFFVLYEDTIQKRLLQLLVSAVPAVMLIVLKLFIFRVPLLVGTGQIKIKFSMLSTLKYIGQSILSIFGITIGPQYLFGYSFIDYSVEKKASILLISALSILSIFIFGYQKIVKNYENRKIEIQKLLVFVFTEGAAILCYAVSSRIEMRELYVPYTLLVLYMMYCIGKIEIRNFFRQFLLAAGLLITTINNNTYKTHIDNLFFMEAMRLGKSAYEIVSSLEEATDCKIYIPNHTDLVWALLLTDQRDIFYMHDLNIEYELYDELEIMLEKLQSKNTKGKDRYVMYMENSIIKMSKVHDLAGHSMALVGGYGHGK